jgi:putative Mg2+ transporter-C (MgtC) family protein
VTDFHHLPFDIFLARLALAAALGAVVGLERERHDRPAGLRTHMLVSAGSALFTLISVSIGGESFDPGRVAAGIITGLGFLGAGTIIRYGGSVRGLTTAASVWAVAGVGMAAAIGWWEAALTATVLMFLSLSAMRALEGRLHPDRPPAAIHLEVRRAEFSLAQLSEALGSLGCRPPGYEYRVREGEEAGTVVVELPDLPPRRTPEVIDCLVKLPGVTSVSTP